MGRGQSPQRGTAGARQLLFGRRAIRQRIPVDYEDDVPVDYDDEAFVADFGFADRDGYLNQLKLAQAGFEAGVSDELERLVALDLPESWQARQEECLAEIASSLAWRLQRSLECQEGDPDYGDVSQITSPLNADDLQVLVDLCRRLDDSDDARKALHLSALSWAGVEAQNQIMSDHILLACLPRLAGDKFGDYHLISDGQPICGFAGAIDPDQGANIVTAPLNCSICAQLADAGPGQPKPSMVPELRDDLDFFAAVEGSQSLLRQPVTTWIAVDDGPQLLPQSFTNSSAEKISGRYLSEVIHQINSRISSWDDVPLTV